MIQTWWLSDQASPLGREIADRHYSRQHPGDVRFTPAGRHLVLRQDKALWVSLRQQFVLHEWAGAWMCSLFRNEGAGLSSDLIRQAVAATRAAWPVVPDRGMVTFVDAAKVAHKRDPGRCFLKAGFRRVGFTKKGLVVLQLVPTNMPDALPALGQAESLFA